MGDPIRSIRELLRAIANGGQLVHREAWEISQANGWSEWTIRCRDGSQRTVNARVAVTAHRRGLVTFERENAE